MKMNLNSYLSRSRAAPGEAKVSTDDGIKKSSGKSFDKKVRQFGTGLKRGLCKAVDCFTPSTLSSKLHSVDQNVVAQSTAFARDNLKEQEQELQERLSEITQRPASYASGTGRAQVSAHTDRQSRTSDATAHNSPPPSNASGMREQKRFSTLPDDLARNVHRLTAEMKAGKFSPPVRVQPERRQTSNNVTHRQPQSRYEHLQMSEAEARRIVRIGVPHDSSDVGDALDQLAKARQVLDDIQEKKDRNKLQKKISEALNPGERNTRVSPLHARLHQEQKEYERILEQQPHYDMSHAALKERWNEQKSAQKRLGELERFAVFDNARRARMDKEMFLQEGMGKVESQLKKLNKRDPGHADFDGDYLGLPNASQLAKMRADWENKLTNLKVDCDLTGHEGIVARWIYEMESGKKAPSSDDVNGILDKLAATCEILNTLKQSNDDRVITRTRLQNLSDQIDKIQREI